MPLTLTYSFGTATTADKLFFTQLQTDLTQIVTWSGAGQIPFPATQDPSADPNTLDDYEEGTWTPNAIGFTVVGTPTYTGTYTKIGRKVHITAKASSTTSIASTAGTSLFNGLPFTPAVAGTGGAVSVVSGTHFGSTIVYTNGNFYMPTWGANAETCVSAEYETT